MTIKLSSTGRAVVAGVASAVLLVGAFTLGTGQGNGSAAAAGAPAAATPAGGAHITVTGTGTVSGTPDQLTLSMGVQTSGSSVSTALQAANQAVRAVSRALRSTGVQASGIQTSGLSIQPNYRSGSQVPSGYSVSESINVTLRDLAAAGSQISAAVRAGGNATVIDGVSLNLSDPGSLLAAARAKAVADAKAKASQYARALGRPLGPVVTMSESSQPQPLPVTGYPMAASRSAAVPVHPGTQHVSVTVTVVFGLG